jgi:hypothetical protein
MTSKYLSSGRSVPALVANILKITGLIITLAALFDILILPMPYQFGDQQWQINFVSSVVDRGIVPLVGIVLFLTGFSINSDSDAEPRAFWLDPRFWALVLASILGLFYVLALPLHISNVGAANQKAIEEINTQATQAADQLNQQIDTEIENRRQQINQLLPVSDSQLSQLVKGGQLQQNQADLIKGFKANPDSVEPFLKKQADELRTDLETQIEVRKKEAQDSRNSDDLKAKLRVGGGSLLLAIGFISVGWMGLRNLRQG